MSTRADETMREYRLDVDGREAYGPISIHATTRFAHYSETPDFILSATKIAMAAALRTMLATHDRRHPIGDGAACEESANETDPDHLQLDCVEAMVARTILARLATQGAPAMTRYEVGNNTDYREQPYVTNNRKAAERIWRSIRPTARAGNRYYAYFRERCHRCGGWQDATVEYVTCACGDPRPARRERSTDDELLHQQSQL